MFNKSQSLIRLGLWGVIVSVSVVVGFVFTYGGVGTWDSTDQLDRCNYILYRFGLPNDGRSIFTTPLLEWYGPLWQLIIGALTYSIFSPLQDPTWVRHALTFSLFPISLAMLWTMIRRSGSSVGTCFLILTLLFSYIRLGGQTILNVADAPFTISYFLSAICSWWGLKLIQSSAKAGEILKCSLRTALITIATTTPYLIRPPVLLPVLLFQCGLGLLIFVEWRHQRPIKVMVSMLPLSVAVFMLFSWLCWPAIWDWGIQGFITSFSIFSKFHAPLIVRAFGVEWPDSSTPWWYPFIWLPVGLTPFALVIVVCGLIEGASTVNHRSWRFSDTPTLRLWLFLWCIATFASLILLRPKLYDEDRHIFFTTPPLLILAGLSLERWSERAKILTSIFLCVTATLTYSSWRQYSYVYKSPIIGEVTGRSFLNDYWGVCVPTVIRYLPKLVPPDATIHLIAYQPIAEMQYRRLFGEGSFSRYSGFGPYYFTRRTPDLPTFYVLRHNRPGMPSVEQVIPNGKKTLLHQELLPSKEEACSLYRITHE